MKTSLLDQSLPGVHRGGVGECQLHSFPRENFLRVDVLRQDVEHAVAREPGVLSQASGAEKGGGCRLGWEERAASVGRAHGNPKVTTLHPRRRRHDGSSINACGLPRHLGWIITQNLFCRPSARRSRLALATYFYVGLPRPPQGKAGERFVTVTVRSRCNHAPHSVLLRVLRPFSQIPIGSPVHAFGRGSTNPTMARGYSVLLLAFFGHAAARWKPPAWQNVVRFTSSTDREAQPGAPQQQQQQQPPSQITRPQRDSARLTWLPNALAAPRRRLKSRLGDSQVAEGADIAGTSIAAPAQQSSSGSHSDRAMKSRRGTRQYEPAFSEEGSMEDMPPPRSKRAEKKKVLMLISDTGGGARPPPRLSCRRAPALSLAGFAARVALRALARCSRPTSPHQ